MASDTTRAAREGALDNPAPRFARGWRAVHKCAAAEAAATRSRAARAFL